MVYAPSPFTFVLEQIEPAEIPVSLDELSQTLARSPLLAPVPEAETADLRIVMQPNAIVRFYRQTQAVALAAFRIPAKRGQTLVRKILRIAEHIAAFEHVLMLEATTDALRTAVKLEFFELTEPATRMTAAEVKPLPRNEQGSLDIRSGQNLAIAMTNQTQTVLNTYLVVLEPQQYRINLIFPQQPELPAKLRPGQGVLVGGDPKYLLQMQLPEGKTSSTDHFKLWVSGSTIQPSVMIMPPLGQRMDPPTDPYGTGSRLDRDLRQSILGQVGSTAVPDFVDDPWWCQTQMVQVVASP